MGASAGESSLGDGRRGMSRIRPKVEEDLDATVAAPESREAEDPRLISAVKEYMALLEAGVHPSRHEFLARYPQIADELSICLDGLAFVHSAAGPWGWFTRLFSFHLAGGWR